LIVIVSELVVTMPNVVAPLRPQN
ncbi:MAG: hypothetical protein QOG95_5450, partial [Mycobacterium sp.]|nr:hypothetical protein [Mycobacterium sp.]